MSRIEDVLRAATHGTAREVEPGSIPHLDLSAVSARRQTWNFRPRLAPAIIGAAIALIAIATVGSRVYDHDSPASPEAAPPYYLALSPVGGSHPFSKSAVLTVRATHSGEVLTTVKPPAGYVTFSLIAGTADPTIFLVGAQQAAPKYAIPPTRLFTLRYQPGVNRAPLSVVPVPPVKNLDTASLSPDGQHLAVVTDGTLSIYDLRTGAHHAWNAGRNAYLTFSGDPHDAAWTADDRTLSLIWTNQNLGGELRLLDTANQGKDLSHDSRGLIRFGRNGFACTSDPFISADGSVVMCGGYTDRSGNWEYPTGVVTTGFGEFSASTGKMIALLDPDRQRLPTTKETEPEPSHPTRVITATVVDQSKLPRLYWASPDGSTLIGTRNGKAFVFRDGQEQRIPWSSGFQTPWWTHLAGVAW